MTFPTAIGRLEPHPELFLRYRSARASSSAWLCARQASRSSGSVRQGMAAERELPEPE
jgi:hypothetical protein